MRQKISIFAVLLVVLGISLGVPGGVGAQANTAMEVINTINQLRAQQGLAPLQIDQNLMNIAQQHSNYQASLGTWTHTGADGSRPIDRAKAAGFGGGAQIYVSENVAYGTDQSILDVINTSWNDPDHKNTMFGGNYRYIGAGVAYSGNLVFYTVDTGYWIGDSQPTSASSSSNPTPEETLPPTPVPVVQSTPAPDGSVSHTVQQGQALWNIAAVYELTIEEIITFNELPPNSILLPGDILLIQPSSTPTITPIGLPSPTLPTRFTHTPSPVGNKENMIPVTVVATPQLTAESIPEVRFRTTHRNTTAIIIGVVLAGSIILYSLISSVIKRDPNE
jgi:LysM repeat protein